MLASLLAFGFFGTLFGSALMRIAGPVLIIIGGLLLLLRAFARPARKA
jgi:hypothetical protein